MSKKSTVVYSVEEITGLALLKAKPPILFVQARGRATSSGWTNPRLEPRVYGTEPADGIYDFDFVADPPTGISLPYLAPIVGEGRLQPMPDWVRGVRIHSKAASMEKNFPSREQALFGIDAAEFVDSDLVRLSVSKESVAPEAEFLLAEEETEAGATFRSMPGKTCIDVVLIRLKGWPEFKTEWVTKCVLSIGGKCKIKTKVPVFFRRESELTISARVCFPSDEQITDQLIDCLKQGVAAGILTGVITGGNLAAAAAALQAYVISCIKAKLGDAAADISLGLHQTKVPGPWKQI